MSNATYAELLGESAELVCDVTQADAALQAGGAVDRTALQPAVSELYVRYTLAANRLAAVYDQLLQPQKRLLVRKLLDACLGRVLELKNDLVNMELSDYSYNDDVLKKLQVSPIEAEIEVPTYFLREDKEKLEGRRHFVKDTLHKLGYVEEHTVGVHLTEQQAVVIIQSHERARQGRLRGQFMKEIRLLKEKSKPDTSRNKEEIWVAAAVVIQRMWRGFITRRRVKKRKIAEMLLIGMIEPPYAESKAISKADHVKEYRRDLQAKHERDYNEALEEIENNLREKYGQRIKEELGDEIRKWFCNYYQRTGKLPEFPTEETGGSRAMFSRQGTESEISKSTPVSSRESSKKSKGKDKKGKNNDGKAKEEEDEIQGYKCAGSNFLADIIAVNEEYEDIWKFKDESSNTQQKHYNDMIERDKMLKIETEIRLIVDEMMRGELELLQAAVDRDRAHRGKKAKKPPKKKVRRSGKKNKKKKEKDLTPDRTTESLFEELVTNGIIKTYPVTPIDSFIGEKSYAADELRAQGLQCDPCLGDIRQLIKEYCIIPLGSEYVHQSAPLIRSVLISGPPGSGKKMLVNAICTEVGAVLFDLTPANIVGKYPGKTGLIMLIHLVNKVSRLLQPAVIWMDSAEKPFVKKIPKTDKTDPKRLKKDLCKMIKIICPEDRVLFVGTSYCPWDAEQKLLQQCYNKFIHIPRPDYGSVSQLWRSRLHRCGALFPSLDVSAVARISDGYSIGSMLESLNAVLTTKRRLQLRVRALTSRELAAALSMREPVYAEQDALAESWWARTPLQRRKQRALQRLEELAKEAEEQALK